MASPNSARLAITPSSRVLQISTPPSSLSDDKIWKRLKEAGFDEESIKRRDKAALIAYIAKLEAEVFEHQYQMGILLMEKKELASKYEQVKAYSEAAELMHKRDQAANLSAIAEARIREESLKKALGVEKECLASIEKALHEMRAECAETKVAAETQLAEARSMVQDAQKKYAEAEAKLHAAESLQGEATRFHRTAERKLREVESREDDLTRRITSFKTDCDEKEKEISLERQSLTERKKFLHQEHERLLDGKTSLNEREDYIFSRTQELSRLEKELEASRASFEEKNRALKEEKSNLELTVFSLSKREEAVIEREALLNKKEQELLVSQEKLASKESNEVQKVMANLESSLRIKKSEFEAELEMKRKLVEDEIETKRRAWELKELDLSQREDALLEREHDLEVKSRAVADMEKDVAERSHLLDEKEKLLDASEKEVELKKTILEQENEEVNKKKLDIQKSLSSLEDKKKQVDYAKEKLEALKSETEELSILEMKLKEELDIVRAQKLELMAEADKLKVEKAKFEAEWDLIDEKREELRKEAEHVAVEREAVSRFLKDERDSIRQERDAMRNQHKQDVESLNREREEFMNKMLHEHSEWFNKIQLERADFLLGFEMQKRELEDCIEKKREELESSLKERENTFEEEKKRELQHICSLKEKAEKELEQVALEMKRLDAERLEINLDRQRREREWAELNNIIEELKVQRQKLEKQRELLHADRKEIQSETENLKQLEDSKIAVDYLAAIEMHNSRLEHSRQKIAARRYLKQQTVGPHVDLSSQEKLDVTNNGNGFSSPGQKADGASLTNPARLSWIKRCSELLFKPSPEKTPIKDEEKLLKFDREDASLTATSSKRQPAGFAFGEPKVILEVPSEDNKVVKGMHGVESEIKKDASEKCVQSVCEDELQGGKKRRVNNDCLDPSELQRQNNKKRRQHQDIPANPSEDAISHRVISKQTNVTEDQHTLISTSHNQGCSGETSVLVIDKIIRISEVTCEKTGGEENFTNQKEIDRLQTPVAEVALEKTEAEKFTSQEQIDRFQTPVAEPDQDTPKAAGAIDHSTPKHVENVVLACVSEAKEIIQEAQLGNVKQVTESNQDISENGDQKLKEHDLAQSGDGEKVGKQVADRTRSKQKL